jgi:hypothetical protein
MEARTESSRYQVRQTLNSDENIVSLFEPDMLVSAQYFENLRSKTLLEPEKRLMLAVLEDAINCFQHNVLAQSGKRKRLFEEAEEWILAGDRDWFFSFENICEVCGINPEYVSHGLLRWKEKKLPRYPDSKYLERKTMAG